MNTTQIDQAVKQEPVACLVGTKGSAFDLPETKRAYTYENQPGNIVAYKLGSASVAATKRSAGDNIDHGLNLLHELHNQGFDVFALGAEYLAPCTHPSPANPMGNAKMLLKKLIECRSSVKNDCNQYDRFILRKEPHCNDVDYEEQKRLHDLLDYIDSLDEPTTEATGNNSRTNPEAKAA